MARRVTPRIGLVALLLALVSTLVLADALDGMLAVRSAYVELEHEVYALHASIEYPMSPALVDALRDGVTLSFEVDARVARERHLWFDATVVELTLRRELAYHTVSDRYVVRDVRSNDQQTFATLDEALEFLSKIDGWPILVQSQLIDGEHYRVSVRAGIRRGRLPASLRALLFWTNDWHRTSGWFSWTLPS
jgi:hypothetical protein